MDELLEVAPTVTSDCDQEGLLLESRIGHRPVRSDWALSPIERYPVALKVGLRAIHTVI